MLVLATGFESHAFVAPMEIVGAGGRTLAEEWADVARAYLGMSVPGFPNLFLLYGPNTNGGSGSVIYTIESAHGPRPRRPGGARARATRARSSCAARRSSAFDRELRDALAGTVWHSGCTNWYVDENGNDPSQWPWLWSTYRRRTAQHRARNVRAEPELNNRAVPDSGSVRRRQAGVLVVGATEREVHPWLRAAGHATRVAPDAKSALTALGEEPADLVIVDRDPGGLDTPDLCRALHADPRLDGAWMLAITAKGSRSDAALAAGADDYLHRPFTRGELLARAGAGLRAARQRSDDRLMRALMLNVPGAIYRSAWHAGHVVELISDEIERIAGYLPSNFVASTRRTLLSIVHPDDLDDARAGRPVRRRARAAPSPSSTGSCAPTARCAGCSIAGRLVPGSGGRLWIDGAMFDVTERRAAEEALREREVERARNDELRASRARIVEAADAARRRIERDLHDGAQQRLVLVSLTLKRAEARAKGTPAEEVLVEASEQLREGLAELRDLAHGIHPAVLGEHGLARRWTASSPAARSRSTCAWRPSGPRRRSRPRSTSRSPRR